MKKIITFILTVSILMQTIVSTNIFAVQEFHFNSEDEISQFETYADGSVFREYSVTYENITDHEIMLYLGISENGYDTAMQVLGSLQEKGYTFVLLPELVAPAGTPIDHTGRQQPK